MPRETFSDQIFRGVVDAIADIREKVVEEPWWGRTAGGERVSIGPQQCPEAPEAAPQKNPEREQEREREHRTPDHDIDR
jgi:hypothetical protein